MSAYTLLPAGSNLLPVAKYTIDVTRAWGAGYAPFLEDVVRMTCVQATIQLMIFFSAGGGAISALLTAELVLLMVYVVFGVGVYWLAVRRLVAFA
jgi:hypothetical protein